MMLGTLNDASNHLHPILQRAGAVIFDMDGVLADTEPAHVQTLRAVLAQHGVALSEAECVALMGLTAEATWQWVMAHHTFSGTPGQLTQEYESILLAALSGGVVAVRGALELVTILGHEGLPLALASSSRGAVVKVVLAGLGLTDAFSTVVCGDDVRQSKPDPTIFLEAARGLGIAAAACVVIEDSLNGMQAGRLAGMTVVGLLSHYTVGVTLPGDLVVESLTDLIDAPDVRSS
jgi:HAD superfamily hydrolase (TIGR01509 family)